MTQVVYAIKRRNEYLPKPKGKRGGSWVEPCDPRKSYVRVFAKQANACRYLTHWLKGIYKCTRSYWGHEDGYEEVVDIIRQPHRQSQDMVIVPLGIEPYNGKQTRFKVMYVVRDDDTGLFLPMLENYSLIDKGFNHPDVITAKYFKSDLAAERFIIKYKRGIPQERFAHPESYYWKTGKGIQSLKQLDAVKAQREAMNISILQYVYKEIEIG